MAKRLGLCYNLENMYLLSVIIPLQGDVLYLSRCLDSLLFDESTADRLEIILTGSREKCAQAKKLLEAATRVKFVPDDGGLGQAIRSSIRTAKGKYIKLVVAKDWLGPWGVGKFLDELEKWDDDVIVNNYQQFYLCTETADDTNFAKGGKDGKTFSLDKSNELVDVLTLSALTIKSALLNSTIPKLPTDDYVAINKYLAIMALAYACTMRQFKDAIYRDFRGRPAENDEEMRFEHRLGCEQIIKALLGDETVQSNPVLAAIVQQMIDEHYELYYQNYSASRKELGEIIAFTKFLRKNFPSTYQQTGAAQNIRLRLAWPKRVIKRKLLAQ